MTGALLVASCGGRQSPSPTTVSGGGAETPTEGPTHEQATALPIEMGDATGEGGEARVSDAEVARVMDDHLDEMYEECIRKELERARARARA